MFLFECAGHPASPIQLLLHRHALSEGLCPKKIRWRAGNTNYTSASQDSPTVAPREPVSLTAESVVELVRGFKRSRSLQHQSWNLQTHCCSVATMRAIPRRSAGSTGLTFREGASLQRMDFSSVEFRRVKAVRADFSRCVFVHSKLVECTFEECVFDGGHIERCRCVAHAVCVVLVLLGIAGGVKHVRSDVSMAAIWICATWVGVSLRTHRL